MQYLLLWLAARNLAVGAFGDFTFALTIGLLLAQMADFGLQVYVQRELSRLALPGAGTSPSPPYFTDERAAAGLVGNGLAIKAGLSVVSLTLLVAVVAVEPVGNKLPVILLGLSMILLAVVDYLAYCFRALGRLQQEAIAYTLGRGTNLALGAALLWTGGGVFGLAVAADFAALAAIVYSYRAILRYVRPNWRLDVSAWRLRLPQFLAVGLGIVFSMAAFRVDNLLIPPVIGSATASQALSMYNAAYKLFELSLVIPGVVLAAAFPLLSRAGIASDRENFGQLLRRVVAALVGFGLLASLVLALGAAPLISLLYGSRFAGSVAILQILAIGCIPMYASYGLTHGLLALDRPHAYATFTLAALVTNVAANLALLPVLGIAGAALATLITEVVMVALCGGTLLRYLRSPRVTVSARTERNAGGTA